MGKKSFTYRAQCGAAGMYIPDDQYAIEGYCPQGTDCGECKHTNCICQYATVYSVCGWDEVLDTLHREYGNIEVVA